MVGGNVGKDAKVGRTRQGKIELPIGDFNYEEIFFCPLVKLGQDLFIPSVVSSEPNFVGGVAEDFRAKFSRGGFPVGAGNGEDAAREKLEIKLCQRGKFSGGFLVQFLETSILRISGKILGNEDQVGFGNAGQVVRFDFVLLKVFPKSFLLSWRQAKVIEFKVAEEVGAKVVSLKGDFLLLEKLGNFGAFGAANAYDVDGVGAEQFSQGVNGGRERKEASSSEVVIAFFEGWQGFGCEAFAVLAEMPDPISPVDTHVGLLGALVAKEN